MAYYPDWVADSFPPEKVDFSRFDWIDFAFAVPNERFGLGFDGTSAGPDLLRRLVAAAHAKGKKVKLSIGGWTGSKYFSLAVASAKTRQTFVNNILSLYKQFNLDGIDIDWEYPGQDGNPGNNINPSDTSNFLAFLKLLRATLPPAARISAAVQTQPFADAHGNPLTNAAPFANVLDWVLMMNYDIWGSSSNPGPNAPLSDACHNSTQPGASADAAVRAWTAAGFPPNKLVLGVPSYGYISKSSATRLRGRQAADDASTSGSDGGGGSDDGNDSGNGSGSSGNGTNTNTGGGGGDGSGTFANGTLPEDPARTSKQVLNDDGNAGDGQLQFRSLVSQGVLCPVKGAHGAYNGCNGFTRYWDGCSNTPFLRSAGAGQVVTYDDAESLGLKASYAHQRGILGVNMFDVHGDTDKWELVDSLRAGLRVAH
ncbi:glycoside hydrolase family 18 protein [Dentipellis sp. KUC8613]|nr:glycoside hydrolase family 18 protein [Dentipellis sp. KUC8613]